MDSWRYPALLVLATASCSPKVGDVAASSDETTTAPMMTTTSTTSTTITTVADSSSTVQTFTSDPTADVSTVADVTTSPTTSGDDTIGTTTGTPMGECTANLVADGGFEVGTPSQAWTESSDQFGTPICDTSCTRDRGAGPYEGDWYVWFGGVADPEHASVSQPVVIDGPTAFLGFYVDINASAGTGDDVFQALIDDTVVFMVSDFDMAAFDGYTPVSIDISDFADGQSHELAFVGDFPGTGLSNFFLDAVTLVSCTPDAGTSSSTSSSSTSTSTSGSSTGSGSST